MKLEETFRAKVWSQSSTGAWHFVTLPDELSKRIRTLTTGLRKPFGSFHVVARTGKTTWETSLFADQKRQAFVLPVKADVRRKEKLGPADRSRFLSRSGFSSARLSRSGVRPTTAWIAHSREFSMSVLERLKAAGVNAAGGACRLWRTMCRS